MIPNFALSLSLEGLKLLHRDAAGWTRLGEVPLDSADLAGDLARLRETARARAPEGLRTKLLIPDDQIRYLALDGARDAGEVAAALEGATPYAVDELVIDFTVRDDRTFVAAVARETLDEAEAFAREHALGPVAFAAVPEPGQFPGEVFFGSVPGLEEAVVRDSEPVRETAQASAPEPAAPVEAAPRTPTPEPPLPAQPSVAAAQVDRTEDDAPEAAPGMFTDLAPPSPLPLDAGDGEDVDPPEAEPVPDPSLAASEAAQDGASGEDRPEPAIDRPAPAAPLPQSPPAEEDEDEALLASTPGPARRLPPRDGTVDDAGTAGDAAPSEDGPRPPRPAAPPASPPLPPRGDTAPPDTPPAPAEDEADASPRAMPPAMPRPGAPPATMPAMPPAGTGAEASDDASTDAESAALAAGAALVAPEPRPSPPQAPAERRSANAASERERMTVFGARRTEPERRPGRVALLAGLAAAVLLALLAMLWLGGSEEEPQAGLLRDATTPVVEEAPDTGAEAAPQPGAPDPAETAPAPLPDYDDYPEPAQGRAAVSPAEAERIYAATGVWLRAPRLPLTPRADSFGAPFSIAVEPVAAAGAARLRLASAAPDGGLPVQADPPPAGSVFARDSRGFIAATAEGTVTPQGLVIYEGRPDLLPPNRPGTVAPPAAAAADAEDDTSETPEGEPVTILVPGATPPARPEGIAPGPEGEGAEATPGGVALDALRPVRRPEDMALAPLPAYDGPRPPLRPEGLVPDAGTQVTEAADAQAQALAQAVGEAPEAPPARASVADALASLMADAPDPLANATPQAVPTARRPDQRPRNFDRVVARSRSRIAAPAPAATAAEPVANTTVRPDGPVPSGVARAATRDNAINLNDINLVGVYGKPGARRALIRMPNGRYLRVGVGDSLNGGRVTAIGDDVLNYVRRGRTMVLKIPD